MFLLVLSNPSLTKIAPTVRFNDCINLATCTDQLICASCRFVEPVANLTVIEGVPYVYLYQTRIAIQVPRLNGRAIILTQINFHQYRRYMAAERRGVQSINALEFIPREEEPIQNDHDNQNILEIEEQNEERNEEQIQIEDMDQLIDENELHIEDQVQPRFPNPNVAEFVPLSRREYSTLNRQDILSIACEDIIEEMDLTYFNRFENAVRDNTNSPPPAYDELEHPPLYDDILSSDDNCLSNEDYSPSSDDSSSNDDSSSDDENSSSNNDNSYSD